MRSSARSPRTLSRPFKARTPDRACHGGGARRRARRRSCRCRSHHRQAPDGPATVIVLDAYAIIAFLRGEQSAAEVAPLLPEPSQLTAINAAELYDQMSRVFGSDPDSVDADLALLSQTGIDLMPVTAELAMEAGRIRARRYHRQSAAVSLADCVAAAAALGEGMTLATGDPALASLVRAEGGQVHALPDSKGRRP